MHKYIYFNIILNYLLSYGIVLLYNTVPRGIFMYIDTEKPILVTSHGRVTQPKGFWHKGNTLKKHMLVVLTSGDLEMKIDGKIYKACGGDALLIPKNTLYMPLASAGCEYYFFHFFTPEAQPNQTAFRISNNPHLPDGEYSYSYFFDVSPVIEVGTLTKNFDLRAQNVLDRVSHLNVWQNGTEKLLLDSYLRELLTLFSVDTSHSNGVDPTLRRLVRYIGVNFKKDISLSTLAANFGISESYIARLFKETLNTCSVDYINGLRIRYACDMLLNSELSIGEISAKAGFNNQYYFTRVFKKQQGITPTEFRKHGKKNTP